MAEKGRRALNKDDRGDGGEAVVEPRLEGRRCDGYSQEYVYSLKIVA